MPAPRSTSQRRVVQWRRTSVYRLTLIRLSLTNLDAPSTGTHIPKACSTRTLQRRSNFTGLGERCPRPPLLPAKALPMTKRIMAALAALVLVCLGLRQAPAGAARLTHYGPLCKVTADCSAGLECMTHRDFAHREVRRTCERPCRTDADCTKGLACKIVDHGPRSTVGGVCMKP